MDGSSSEEIRERPVWYHSLYMGSTGGGVWKTTDAGESWQNISDGFIEAGSIGDIQVAASDPNIILVTPDGLPKLLDFGIAKLLNPELL